MMSSKLYMSEKIEEKNERKIVLFGRRHTLSLKRIKTQSMHDLVLESQWDLTHSSKGI